MLKIIAKKQMDILRVEIFDVEKKESIKTLLLTRTNKVIDLYNKALYLYHFTDIKDNEIITIFNSIQEDSETTKKLNACSWAKLDNEKFLNELLKTI